MARPVERPTPTQLEQMRKAAHKAIDHVLDAVPKIIVRMREYEGGGLPAHSPGVGSVGRGGIADPVAAKAFSVEPDPNDDLRAWLESERELLRRVFAMAEQVERLS